MKVDVWKCDKCGVEFREGVVHYEEFDFCPICTTDLTLKRKDFDDELEILREARRPKEYMK